MLDAAGFDTIIVETVGAGQSDVEIAKLADTRVVVCPPGLGDDVQAIKAGILEIADVLVVSKGDLPGSRGDRARSAGHAAASPHRRRARAGAQDGGNAREGIAAVIDAVIAHAADAGRGRRFARDRQREPSPWQTKTPTAADIKRLATRDPFVNAVGIRCIDAGPGHATVALDVGDAHINFNGKCHGGAIFTLADTAFGLASNSHGMIAVGIDAHITYHVAAQAGDTLTATRGRSVAHAQDRGLPHRSEARRRGARRRLHRHRLRPRAAERGRARRRLKVSRAWLRADPVVTCTCRTRGPICGRDVRRRPSPSAAAPAGISDR